LCIYIHVQAFNTEGAEIEARRKFIIDKYGEEEADIDDEELGMCITVTYIFPGHITPVG